MDYTQLFRNLREARGLTLEQLAKLARLHRNTVVNIESGRPVKFKTIAGLMRQMGYAPTSPEMKSMAFLWLESVSGIPFSRPETERSVHKSITAYRSTSRHAAARLEDTVAKANLTPEQIQLLMFAATHPDLLAIVGNIRDLLAGAVAPKSAAPLLHAAEDPAEYGER
jgi:transcriptional regulator with XRE-family HTH domain